MATGLPGFHSDAQTGEKMLHTLLRRLCVQRHTAAALWWRWYGRSNIDAVPAPPWLAPILLFPVHCDSCWDRLLGDHIPGTKRAQLVWTGLSDTTSCSGCESLLSMQAFKKKIKKKRKNHMSCFFAFFYFTCVHPIIGHELEAGWATACACGVSF